MKALVIVALVLGLGAVAASVYAKVETHGNYEYMKTEIETRGPATQFDIPLRDEYKATLDKLHYAAWAAGGLALVLGALALRKSQKKGLPAAAILLGLAGAGLSFLSMP
jgi:hypothetical protein